MRKQPDLCINGHDDPTWAVRDGERQVVGYQSSELRFPAANIWHHGFDQVRHAELSLLGHQTNQLIHDTNEADVPDNGDVTVDSFLDRDCDTVLPFLLSLRCESYCNLAGSTEDIADTYGTHQPMQLQRRLLCC